MGFLVRNSSEILWCFFFCCADKRRDATLKPAVGVQVRPYNIGFGIPDKTIWYVSQMIPPRTRMQPHCSTWWSYFITMSQ